MEKICAGSFFPVQYDVAFYSQVPLTRTVSRIHPFDPALTAVLTGECQVDAPPGKDNWTVRAGPGDVLYLPGDLERVEQNTSVERYTCMGFYFRWTAAPPPLPRKVHDHYGMIRAMGEALLSVAESPLPQVVAMRNSYLTAMIAEYLRLATALGEGLEAKVTRYVQDHMSEQISLDDLAAHLGIDPSHLGRKYKTLTGRTLMHDVRRVKVEYAVGSLRCRVNNLKTAAAAIGLDDPLQLSRWLRKYVGVSVRDLRK